MDSRERVFISLGHEEPDRVPRDLWATRETVAKLRQHLKLPDAAAVWDHFDVDLRYLRGPAYVGPPLETHADCERDIWGVPRTVQATGEGDRRQTYKSVVRSPLAGATSMAELADYVHWPSPDWYDYTVVRAQAMAIRNQGRVAVFMGDRLNRIAQLKPLMYLRGVAQALVDMAVEPQIYRYIIDRVTDFYNQYITRVLEAAGGMIDIVCTGDDFGQQNGLLCSRAMWNERLRPGFAEYIRLLHQGGVKVMHHSCGAVRELMPDFIDCGLDILQALQPGTAGMDFTQIKEEFGDRLCFQGGIGIQGALPFGSPADVRAEVQDHIQALAPRGGYIVSTSHNLQGDTPVTNIIALFEAYDEFGRYRR